MNAVRVVLVDPVDESREALQRLLQGLDSVWLAEVCKSYSAASKAIGEQGPDLVVIVLDGDREEALRLISSAVRQNPTVAVLPASTEVGGDVILRTVRAGAREFLALPADPAELLVAIGNLVQAPANGACARLGGRVVVLTGASGGVGCTSLATNLACTLARDVRRSVALVDFDLTTGAVDACLDIVPNYTLVDVAQNPERLDLTLLKRSMARHSSGVYVLPRPATLEDAARIEPDSLGRVLALLKAAFSFVLIDGSKALHESDFVAFQAADMIGVVAQLELACLRNTSRLLQVLRQEEELAGKVKLVLNRTGAPHCQIQPRKAEELLSMAAAWSIPEACKEFTVARAKGAPLHVEFGRSRAQKAIEEIADALSDDKAEKKGASAPPVRRIAAMF